MNCSETEKLNKKDSLGSLKYFFCSVSGCGGVCDVDGDEYCFSLFFITGLRHVSGIDIYTPSEVEAVNGTNVKLKCTFSSSHPVTLQSIIVSWNFRPINSRLEESVCICFVFMKNALNVSLVHFDVINEIQS